MTTLILNTFQALFPIEVATEQKPTFLDAWFMTNNGQV